MSVRGLLQILALSAGLAACQPSGAAFDYWVLALSWSPEHCASSAARPGSKQCSRPREFIVHGLWPQYERGYPENCETSERVSSATAERLSELVPDRGLLFHQWRKHGSCSGLGADGYFRKVEQAAKSITVPPDSLRQAQQDRISHRDFEDAFIAANPGMTRDSIVFECRRNFLREVRVCLDHNLKPRACGEDLREACGKTIKARRSS